MTALPAKSTISGTPTRAQMNAGQGQLWDALNERLFAGGANSSEQDAAAAALGVPRITQLYGQRNRLINGGFQINQRGLTSVADDAYCLDRWYVLTETGSVTVTQQTDQEHGTPFNIRLTQPDASAKRIGLAQIIEAANCKDLRNKITTLAGRLRCSAATQINYAVLEWTGTADSVTSDFISAWGGSPTYIASITERAKGTLTPGAATWTDMPALNATINTGVNNVIVFVWTNSTLAQNATLDLGRMQFEPGAFATPFEFLPHGQVLSLCQRYLPALISDGTVSLFGPGSAGSTTSFTVNVSFQVPARAVPSSIVVSSASHVTASIAGVTFVSSAIALGGARSKLAASLGLTLGSSTTAGFAGQAYFTSTSGSILFEGCEL